jgi:L-asparaginase II
VAVAVPEGRLVAGLGDPQLATFLRSAAKPFQALPLLEAGGAERFSLSDADLAVICASHSGTPEHVAQVRSLLDRGGFSPAGLLCGAHPPFHPASAEALCRAGEEPSPLHNNCSGKHAGMLLACRLLDLDPAGYLDPGHPLQRRILARVAVLCRLEEGRIGLGTDGCSLPAFRLPLANAAYGFAALADPRAAGLPADLVPHVERIVRAMTAAPAMVAGPGRFTTRLMEATGGRVLGKEGAEGFYGLAVRGPVALGIAIKIADGGERCRDGVVIDALREMGSLAAAEFADLEELHAPPLYNHRGMLVGRITPDLELEEL